jgi:O-antigen/teichoic acid export membrane protein
VHIVKKLFFSGLVVNLLILAINFITGILSARYLGPTGRGELTIIMQWLMLLSGLSAFGLPGAVVYLGKTLSNEKEYFFGAYLIIGPLAGLLGLIAGEVFLPFILGGYSENVLNLLRIMLITLPFVVLADGIIGHLQTLNEYKKIMMFKFSLPLGSLVIVLILIMFNIYNVRNFIITYYLWNMVVLLFLFTTLIRKIKPKFKSVLQYSRQLSKKGVQIFGTVVVGVFSGGLDQIVISMLLSNYVLGLYSVAISIGTIVPSLMIGSLSFYFWPKLMDLNEEERTRKVEDTHSLLFYGSMLICLFGSIATYFLLPVLYGNEYLLSIPMAITLLLVAPFKVAHSILISFMNTKGQFHRITLAEIVGLLSGISAMYILFPVIGNMGAPIGVVVSSLVKWCLMFFWSYKLGITPSNMMTIKPQRLRNLIRSAGTVKALNIFNRKVRKYKEM